MRTNRKQRVLLTATAVTATAGLMGIGSWATWSDSQTKNETIHAGAFSLRLDGDLASRAEVPVVSFAPGDSVTRRVDLTNDGTIDFASIAMQVTGDGDSPLLDGTAKGLQVQVRECRTAWYQSSDEGAVDGWACDDGTRPAGDYDLFWQQGELVLGYAGPHSGLYDANGSWVGWETVASAGQTLLDGPFTSEPRNLEFGALRGTEAPNVLTNPNPVSDSTHLLVKVSMPAADGAEQDVKDEGSDYARYGNQATTLKYTFTATQRDGNKVVAGGYVDDANGHQPT